MIIAASPEWTKPYSDAEKARNAFIDALEVCCEDFRAALRWETDNEGYGALIHPKDGPDDDESPIAPGWYIGSDLAPMKHCPWCATLLVGVTPELVKVIN
jgi:hypothetical protein